MYVSVNMHTSSSTTVGSMLLCQWNTSTGKGVTQCWCEMENVCTSLAAANVFYLENKNAQVFTEFYSVCTERSGYVVCF